MKPTTKTHNSGFIVFMWFILRFTLRSLDFYHTWTSEWTILCTQISEIAPQQPPGRAVTQLSIHISVPAQVRHVKATLNYVYQVNRHPAVKRKWLQLQSVGKGEKWIESRRYIITVIVCESLLLCICFVFSLSACFWWQVRLATSVSALMLTCVQRVQVCLCLLLLLLLPKTGHFSSSKMTRT